MARKHPEDRSATAVEIAPEVEAAHPRSPAPPPAVEAAIEDADRLKMLAHEIVRGRIEIEQVSNLSTAERESVSRLVEEMIALKSDPAVRRQRGSTTGYNPSGSIIIKDGH